MARNEASMICTHGHSICISEERNLVVFGSNVNGELGCITENVFPPKVPLALGTISIKSVKCGDRHTVCLDVNGNVFSFGSNKYGQLGINKRKELFSHSHIPQKVELPVIKQIACGINFTICLCESGNLYSFGLNVTGQLGIGNTRDYIAPQLIETLQDIEFVECGGSFAVCKSYDNSIYCWGNNFHGQLGNGDRYSKHSPVKCVNWPDDTIDIKCGLVHILLLTFKGDVYACGYNESGQLGLQSDVPSCGNLKILKSISNIVRIECGEQHSMCIDKDNHLFVFGDNSYGQLGLGDTSNRNEPIKHPSLSNIIDISKGGNHTFVKTSNNEIYAFGQNKYSQLGIKTENEDQLTPIRVFEDNEDIWFSNIKSKQKSARF